MNKIWANRLIAGTKSWEDVIKANRVDGVLEELRRRVEAGEITAAKFEAITGEVYAAE